MTKEAAVRVLSNDELETVSGGQDDLVVCVRTQSVDLGFMKINWASCENGQTIVYPTFD
jgi:bacteriocin-like protein